MDISATYSQILKDFISFKSISTDKAFSNEINKTADFLYSLFKENNFEVEKIEGYGNPIIVASYTQIENAPTCLIYGHYDVQPAEQSEGWDSEPFETSFRTDKNSIERIYARGIVDNKGQTLVHIATVLDLIKEKNLKYNIKFMLEGDEETGSPKLEEFVIEFKSKLECDFVMISDGTLIGENPVIEASFRGGFNSTLKFKTAEYDLHSGLYGGGLPNAALELSEFLSRIYDENNKINIEKFYDDVDELSEETIENNKSIPFSIEDIERVTGAKAVRKETDVDYYSAVSLRPSVQVTGVRSGYTGVGYRNGIPNTAEARLNFRLAPSQNPQRIVEVVQEYLEKNIPEYIDWSFEISDPYKGIKLDLNNEFVEESVKSLESTFDKPVLNVFVGGGLPIVTLFDEILNVPQVLVPLGNEDCNMHAINENYNVEILKKALNFSSKFFSK